MKRIDLINERKKISRNIDELNIIRYDDKLKKNLSVDLNREINKNKFKFNLYTKLIEKSKIEK